MLMFKINYSLVGIDAINKQLCWEIAFKNIWPLYNWNNDENVTKITLKIKRSSDKLIENLVTVEADFQGH